MVIVGTYVIFISKDWYKLLLVHLAIGILSLFSMMLLLPESPKWLSLNGKREKAIDSFQYIANFNHSPTSIAKCDKFDEQARLDNQDPDVSFEAVQTTFSTVNDTKRSDVESGTQLMC